MFYVVVDCTDGSLRTNMNNQDNVWKMQWDG